MSDVDSKEQFICGQGMLGHKSTDNVTIRLQNTKSIGHIEHVAYDYPCIIAQRVLEGID